jgi:hypothetical protein
MDKRKSHFSSMIITGQMTREEALRRLEANPYPTDQMRDSDMEFIAGSIGMTREEFGSLMRESPMLHTDYPISKLNDLSSLARKFRRFLGE